MPTTTSTPTINRYVVGVIVGVVIGVALLLLLVIAAMVMMCVAISRNRTKKYNVSSNQGQSVFQLQSLEISKNDLHLENNVSYGLVPQPAVYSSNAGALHPTDLLKGDFVDTSMNANT